MGEDRVGEEGVVMALVVGRNLCLNWKDGFASFCCLHFWRWDIGGIERAHTGIEHKRMDRKGNNVREICRRSRHQENIDEHNTRVF